MLLCFGNLLQDNNEMRQEFIARKLVSKLDITVHQLEESEGSTLQVRNAWVVFLSVYYYSYPFIQFEQVH